MKTAIPALILLVAGCSTMDSQAAKAASGIDGGMLPREVIRELGQPAHIEHVSPQVEEWYYSYSGGPPQKYVPNEPAVRWSPAPAAKLIVRFENGEVVSWRRE
ncbi:MAG TPA: hypothetical protein VI643_05455 [Planctomycetota bacterium]|nr:hypothetical protein [Planctomycetota bacterium]